MIVAHNEARRLQILSRSIGIVVGVYMLCSLIDLPRHYLFKILKVEERFIALEERLKQKIKGKMHP